MAHGHVRVVIVISHVRVSMKIAVLNVQIVRAGCVVRTPFRCRQPAVRQFFAFVLKHYRGTISKRVSVERTVPEYSLV